ncbi:MAG: diacylglycerol kinase family lipid kinase [Pirellulaceae bacterium]|nr:diacylglycerol kinase family lipid kinase [Pirellulaceae bacterium]
MNGFDFIVNPASGNGRAKKSWDLFEQARGGLGTDRVHWTKHRGHAQEIARQLQHDGASCIVAVGGDGLLNEVVNGMYSGVPSEFPDTPHGVHETGAVRRSRLAHLPAGSGCDFARHFQIPKNPQVWQDVLESKNVAPVDVGKVTWEAVTGETCERYFVTLAMAGIAGDIAETMDRWGKPLGGFLSYLIVSLKHLLVAKARKLTLTVDGEKLANDSYHLVTLANTATTAGMRIAPEADAGDGKFDLVLVRGMSRMRLLWNFRRIYQGTHVHATGVEYRKVETLSAESGSVNVLMNIDGEPLGRLPAKFELVPSPLELMVP